MVSVARAVVAASLIAVGAFGQSSFRCGKPFASFDTRLSIEVIGILPNDGDTPIGLEITPAGPIVAARHHVYAISANATEAIPVDGDVEGISVDSSGRLALQTAGSVSFAGRNGWEPITSWTGLIEGRIFNSGQPTFIEALEKGGRTSFAARRPTDGQFLPVTRLDGVLHAASWDDQGLLAVVGDSLFRWVKSTNVLERIALDKGFESAIGLCSISATRLIVGFRDFTLLMSGTSRTVIAAVGGFCRASASSAVLIDPKTRRVWKLGSLEDVGEAAQNLAHANRLLRLSVAKGVPFDATPEFGEAVRLIGCKNATDIARQLQK